MSTSKITAMFLMIALFGSLYASNVFASGQVTILSPEQGQAFYGAPYTLPIKLQHTPGYDVGVGFEAAPLHIPGITAYVWKHETVQVLSKDEISPGITIVKVLIPKGGDWKVRASQQPKQSPTPGIAGPWREFVVVAPGEATAGATIGASISTYNGPCPVNMVIHGVIGSAVKGTVQYQLIRSWDSLTTPLQTEKFDGPGTIKVTTNYPFDFQKNPQDPTSGWMALRILSNGKEYISNHADFKISCQTGIDPNLVNILKKDFIGWKSLEKLAPPPQSCQACVSTYRQIADIDQKSMPLVQEGEELVAGGGQDQAKVQRVKQIQSQLDSNMIQRRTLVTQYNSQVSNFQMTQKRLVNPVERKGLNPQPEPPARTVR